MLMLNADVVMGVAPKPASQIEQNKDSPSPDGMVKLTTTSFQAQNFTWSSFFFG
jgi:hypothetical protein